MLKKTIRKRWLWYNPELDDLVIKYQFSSVKQLAQMLKNDYVCIGEFT